MYLCVLLLFSSLFFGAMPSGMLPDQVSGEVNIMSTSHLPAPDTQAIGSPQVENMLVSQ